jgi:hypothetical protein
MAEWRSVSFQIPEAKLLADLAGIETDLIAVERTCDRFIAECAKELPDWEFLQIACAAVLIRYGRAFTSGIRAGLPSEVIDTLDPEHQKWHQYFKDTRDKWIAHSVNSFEENEVRAWLMPLERGPNGVTGISVLQHRVTSLGSDDITMLKTLSTEVRRRVGELKAAENVKVLALARTLPPEPFYTQVDTARKPGERDPSKARMQK